jgi:hypothetical protein
MLPNHSLDQPLLNPVKEALWLNSRLNLGGKQSGSKDSKFHGKIVSENLKCRKNSNDGWKRQIMRSLIDSFPFITRSNCTSLAHSGLKLSITGHSPNCNVHRTQAFKNQVIDHAYIPLGTHLILNTPGHSLTTAAYMEPSLDLQSVGIPSLLLQFCQSCKLAWSLIIILQNV